MRRSFLLTIVISMAFLTGCQGSKVNVFFIMFESTPNLVDNAVYAHGVSVGEIVETATAGNGITRLAIVVNGDQKDLMKDNAAFYVDTGRLTHATLSGYGNLIEPGAKLMGFSSGMGMGWFKAKNLMTQTSRAASGRAEALFAAFEASYKGQ